MGSRYLISGVQVGMLKGLNQSGQKEELEKLLQVISDKQYVGYSNNTTIENDSSELRHSKKYDD